MTWLAILFIVLVIVILWLLYGSKKDEHPETVTAVSPQAPTPVVAVPVKGDDLKIIEGVGPKIAGILNEAGVSTFAQMAQKTGSELRKILDDGGIGAMADPSTWPEQAALAAEGKMEALKELQDKLQGGRKA